MQDEPRPSRAEPAAHAAAPVVALVADLLFASRIRGAAQVAGVSAITVRSAEELLQRVETLSPRLILVDVDARGADPPAVIARLKSNPRTRGIPIVAFGSHVNREAIQAARAAGADRFLARSAFVRELASLLRGGGAAGS